eukprot:122883-Prymnesium_polylepis.1
MLFLDPHVISQPHPQRRFDTDRLIVCGQGLLTVGHDRSTTRYARRKWLPRSDSVDDALVRQFELLTTRCAPHLNDILLRTREDVPEVGILRDKRRRRHLHACAARLGGEIHLGTLQPGV